MNKRIKIFFAVLAFVVIMSIGIYYFSHGRNLSKISSAVGEGMATDTAQIIEYDPPQNDIAPTGSHTYINSTYGFSLQYPDGLAVEDRTEAANGRTITFESADGSQGFQIFITPYVQTQIDKSRIDLDTHGTAEGTPTEIVLQNGTHALAFFSSDPILGRLREVWFLDGGYLYEVTTYDTLDSWLASIMQTWKFDS